MFGGENMDWILKFYLTETAYKSGIAAHQVPYKGDRNGAVNTAQAIMRGSNFKYYEVVQK